MLNSGNLYFYNGKILTMDKKNPKSDHLLVINGQIVNAESDVTKLGINYKSSDFDKVRTSLANEIEFIDLQGKTLIPGLTDAHAHFVWWGLNLIWIDLSEAKSEEECVEILKANSVRKKPGEWILGLRWSQNLWDNTNLPSKKSLDAAFPDNPVMLESKCFHLTWANSFALEKAGITSSTPNPEGGEVEKDQDGNPTGILKETAMNLLSDLIPAPNDEDRFEALERAQQLAHSYGITTVHEPDTLEIWSFLQKAHAQKKLSMRVHFWIPVAALSELESLKIQNDLGDDRLRITAVKMFADGSLGGRTALMHEPYENEPDNYGIAVSTREEIREATLRANRAGLSMSIHAIGDKAVDNVLSAYEEAREELGGEGTTTTNPTLRNRIEHLQVFSDSDLERLKKVSPVISMQPVHLCGDMTGADKFWGKRAKNAYAFRTVIDSGLLLAFGSDIPVETVNPYHGIYAAVTRNRIDGTPGDGWYPEQKITLQEALEAYTINCAKSSGVEDKFGSLEYGKIADLVILPLDLEEASIEQIRDIKPVATYSGGKCVYKQ